MKHEVKPTSEQFEKAREMAQEMVEKCQSELPKEEKVVLELGWTEDEFVKQNLNGCNGRSWGPNRFLTAFNSDADNWQNAFRSMVAHEYAHTWWFEQKGRLDNKKWEFVLDEAVTQLFEERMVPEHDDQKKEKFSKEEVAEYWPKIRDEELDKDARMTDPIYVSKYADEDTEWPNWLGYSLSYYIGKELLKQHELEEFTELGKEDVVETGNKLFG